MKSVTDFARVEVAASGCLAMFQMTERGRIQSNVVALGSVVVLVIVQSMLCSRCDEFDSQAGHNVSQHGYYKMPEETAKAFILHPDGKIWFHTGDIGVM